MIQIHKGNPFVHGNPDHKINLTVILNPSNNHLSLTTNQATSNNNITSHQFIRAITKRTHTINNNHFIYFERFIKLLLNSYYQFNIIKWKTIVTPKGNNRVILMVEFANHYATLFWRCLCQQIDMDYAFNICPYMEFQTDIIIESGSFYLLSNQKQPIKINHILTNLNQATHVYNIVQKSITFEHSKKTYNIDHMPAIIDLMPELH